MLATCTTCTTCFERPSLLIILVSYFTSSSQWVSLIVSVISDRWKVFPDNEFDDPVLFWCISEVTILFIKVRLIEFLVDNKALFVLRNLCSLSFLTSNLSPSFNIFSIK